MTEQVQDKRKLGTPAMFLPGAVLKPEHSQMAGFDGGPWNGDVWALQEWKPFIELQMQAQFDSKLWLDYIPGEIHIPFAEHYDINARVVIYARHLLGVDYQPGEHTPIWQPPKDEIVKPREGVLCRYYYYAVRDTKVDPKSRAFERYVYAPTYRSPQNIDKINTMLAEGKSISDCYKFVKELEER